jgi:RNA polymerase sigma factor (sigma-70 family)
MEGELARAFRRGDRDALTRVYHLYIADVERVVRIALIGVKAFSASNLADVVQEVFLRAFSQNGRTSYDGLREYRPYLLVIARNVVISWAQRTGREIPTGAIPENVDSREINAATGEGAVFDPVSVSVAAQYVESLPAELRAVHHRRFVLAEPQREAAVGLGISRQNLRTLEKKLVTGLREALRRAGLDVAREEARPLQPALPAGGENPQGGVRVKEGR